MKNEYLMEGNNFRTQRRPTTVCLTVYLKDQYNNSFTFLPRVVWLLSLDYIPEIEDYDINIWIVERNANEVVI